MANSAIEIQSIWMRDLHATDTRRVSHRSLNAAYSVKSAGFSWTVGKLAGKKNHSKSADSTLSPERHARCNARAKQLRVRDDTTMRYLVIACTGCSLETRRKVPSKIRTFVFEQNKKN
jgi:hypothetical protein